MRIAAHVANDKMNHPDQFCPEPRCLWRTGGNFDYCPRHQPRTVREAVTAQRIREGRLV